MAQEKRVAKGFSFSPEVIGVNKDGEHVVEDAAHYTLFITHSNGRLAYVAKENKYYLGEGAGDAGLCPPERLDQLMRYLRWNFDNLIDETVATKDPITEKTVMKKTGFKVSTFPPTIENIQAKREELREELMQEGRMYNADLHNEILAKTSPTQMCENEAFQAYLDEVPADARLARRIAGQTGF